MSSFISLSYLIIPWMTRIGITMMSVFNLPCPYYDLMFKAWVFWILGCLLPDLMSCYQAKDVLCDWEHVE